MVNVMPSAFGLERKRSGEAVRSLMYRPSSHLPIS
jgi:hypothetical protein